MIALFGRDEYALLGLGALLDVEKIPYRRVARLEGCNPDLLIVATGNLTGGDAADLVGKRALVIHGGSMFARRMFGGEMQTREEPSSVSLEQSIWTPAVREIARRFGKRFLHLPAVPVCWATDAYTGTVLARAVAARRPADVEASYPLIMQHERCVWSAVDLGAAFAHLLTERKPAVAPGALSRLVAPRWMRRTVEGVYYAAPRLLRRWLQRGVYAWLQSALCNSASVASDFPVDATGWLLIELVKRLIVVAGGKLVRLERWPAPFASAATLTHDVEPRRYAYTVGVNRLLSRSGADSPAAFGLVAEATTRFLRAETAERLRKQTVFCHGLTHRGETVRGRAQVSDHLCRARARLEGRLGCQIRGYRSPRLDRSDDLAWALDHCGFAYDSSYPDVDRENVQHFGAGVRVNVPFRTLVEDAGDGLRYSRCLELPLTAPDCVQPLLAGESLAKLREVVQTKAAFVRMTGGLYVALVHCGVFGDQDAALREEHRAFVCDQLSRESVWLADIEKIVQWWSGREALQLTVCDGAVNVTNDGPQPISGARLVIEGLDDYVVIPISSLEPGAHVRVGTLQVMPGDTSTSSLQGSTRLEALRITR